MTASATVYKPALVIPISIAHSALSMKAKLVWGQLKFHLNRATGQCNPGYKVIAQSLCISESTVGRAIDELRCAGLISSTKRIRASSYILREPDDAADVTENHYSRHVKLTDLDTSNCRRKTRQTDAAKEPVQMNLFKGNGAAAANVEDSCAPVEPEQAAAAAASPPERAPDPTPTPNAPAAPPADLPQRIEPQVDIKALAFAIAEKLIEVHPQPGLSHRASGYIETILRQTVDPLKAGEQIWTNHLAWRDYWARLEAGKFIPQLWRWFADRDWERKPVIRTPARKLSSVEQAIEYDRECRRRKEQEQQRRTA